MIFWLCYKNISDHFFQRRNLKGIVYRILSDYAKVSMHYIRLFPLTSFCFGVFLWFPGVGVPFASVYLQPLDFLAIVIIRLPKPRFILPAIIPCKRALRQKLILMRQSKRRDRFLHLAYTTPASASGLTIQPRTQFPKA